MGFKTGDTLPAGSIWTIIEMVSVEIFDEFDDPIVTMWKKNTGSMVGLNPRTGDELKEIEFFSLPFFIIQKLVREAEKLDAINRAKLVRFSPEFKKILKEMHEKTTR